MCAEFGIDVRRAIATATHVVRMNRTIIRAVAGALLEHGELTYGQVMQAFDPFSPTASRSVLLVDRLWEKPEDMELLRSSRKRRAELQSS